MEVLSVFFDENKTLELLGLNFSNSID